MGLIMSVIFAEATDQPLLTAADLGGSFTDEQAVAIGEEIRSLCGWHIAPEATQTVAVDAIGGRYLFLPTLHLISVDGARVDDEPITGWSNAATPRFRAGCVLRRDGWPCDPVDVDIVHGYTECPSDLKALAIRLLQSGKIPVGAASRTTGPFRIDFRSGFDPGSLSLTDQATIRRYRIPR